MIPDKYVSDLCSNQSSVIQQQHFIQSPFLSQFSQTIVSLNVAFSPFTSCLTKPQTMCVMFFEASSVLQSGITMPVVQIQSKILGTEFTKTAEKKEGKEDEQKRPNSLQVEVTKKTRVSHNLNLFCLRQNIHT